MKHFCVCMCGMHMCKSETGGTGRCILPYGINYTRAHLYSTVYLHLLLSMSVCHCILGIHSLRSSCLLFYISIFFFCEDNVKYEVISESFFTKILLALGTNVLWWTSCDRKLLLLESLHM